MYEIVIQMKGDYPEDIDKIWYAIEDALDRADIDYMDLRDPNAYRI